MRRRRFIFGLCAAALSAPFINRHALGQMVAIRLARLVHMSAEERQAFDAFAATLKVTSNDTIDVSLVEPARPSMDDVLLAMAAGQFAGLYGSAVLFAKRHRIYDPPEPGFSLVGNTLAAFETREQQAEWFEQGGGKDAANAVYVGLSLLSIGILPRPAGRLVLNRRIASLDGLRGLRISEQQRGFTADLLSRAGIEPLYDDVARTPAQRRRGPPDGWMNTYDVPSPTEFVLDAPVMMETCDITLNLRVRTILTDHQRALFEQHVRQYAQALRVLIAQREDSWYGRLAAHRVEVVDWPLAERLRLRLLTNRFLREWAAAGLPSDRGGPSSREALVESIEIFQRNKGLI